MRYSKFRQKEVVNVVDGKSLGCIADLEIDVPSGKICAIVVPGTARGHFGLRSRCCVVPWSSICKIGEDVILVETNASVGAREGDG